MDSGCERTQGFGNQRTNRAHRVDSCVQAGLRVLTQYRSEPDCGQRWRVRSSEMAPRVIAPFVVSSSSLSRTLTTTAHARNMNGISRSKKSASHGGQAEMKIRDVLTRTVATSSQDRVADKASDSQGIPLAAFLAEVLPRSAGLSRRPSSLSHFFSQLSIRVTRSCHTPWLAK